MIGMFASQEQVSSMSDEVIKKDVAYPISTVQIPESLVLSTEGHHTQFAPRFDRLDSCFSAQRAKSKISICF